MKPRIIAESLLQDKNHLVPEDYKVYCFNGKPKYIVIFHNRFDDSKQLSESVYNLKWEKQNISLDEPFEISKEEVEKPKCLDEMIDISYKLCSGYPLLRLDYYIINNKIYFGEITFHTASGLQPMIPKELDQQLGKEIIIPIDTKD